MARNQKLSYKMNVFHFLTKQNYSKYSQISMSMSFSSSEASTMLYIPGHYKARTKSRSHCKILDRELNYMKTKYSHFEIEHELSEERILMPYVTSSK